MTTDDDDMGAIFRDMKEASKLKRAANRHGSAEILTERGIAFESKNGGAHLIVKHNGKVVDMWPGTGRWIFRGGTPEGRGIMNLIRLLTTTGA